MPPVGPFCPLLPPVAVFPCCEAVAACAGPADASPVESALAVRESVTPETWQALKEMLVEEVRRDEAASADWLLWSNLGRHVVRYCMKSLGKLGQIVVGNAAKDAGISQPVLKEKLGVECPAINWRRRKLVARKRRGGRRRVLTPEQVEGALKRHTAGSSQLWVGHKRKTTSGEKPEPKQRRTLTDNRRAILRLLSRTQQNASNR